MTTSYGWKHEVTHGDLRHPGSVPDLVAWAISLDDAERLVLLTCPAVESEVQRILADKLHLSAGELEATAKLLSQFQRIPDGSAPPPPNFPDPDNWPILAAALDARADLFVTGDKDLLALGAVEALPILDPRAAYLKLRGLA